MMYDVNYVTNLLFEKKMGLNDLSDALGIDVNAIYAHLIKGEKIAVYDMIKIDAAMSILTKLRPKRPNRKRAIPLIIKKSEGRDTSNLCKYDQNFRFKVEMEVLHREEEAIDDICFIIGYSNPNMTNIRYDPNLDNIEGYSVEEFKKRILERIHLD